MDTITIYGGGKEDARDSINHTEIKVFFDVKVSVSINANYYNRESNTIYYYYPSSEITLESSTGKSFNGVPQCGDYWRIDYSSNQHELEQFTEEMPSSPEQSLNNCAITYPLDNGRANFTLKLKMYNTNNTNSNITISIKRVEFEDGRAIGVDGHKAKFASGTTLLLAPTVY